MTWRDVLDCKRTGTHQDRQVDAAISLGYRFIAFNGRILFVCRENGEARCHDTGITTDKLDRTAVLLESRSQLG